MPTFNIEDVTNVALCQRLGRLEAHISMLDQSVAQHTVQLTDMKQHGPTSGCYDAQSNRAASPKASTQGSSTSKRIVLVPSVDVPGAQHQAKSSNVPNVQTDMYAPDTSSNIDNVRTVVKSDSHSIDVSQVADLPRSPPKDNSVVKNKVISDAPCVLPTTSNKTMRYVICQDKEKNWSVVQKKKNVQIGKKIPTVINGKATNTIIRAAFRKKTHIYLGDVDNDVSNSDIIDYLTGAGIKVLTVVRLSSVNAPNRSCVSSRGAQSTELVSLYIGYWTLNNYYYYYYLNCLFPLPIMKRYLTKSCGKRVQESGSGVHMVGSINFIFNDSRPTYLLIYLGTFVHFLVYTFF